LLLLFLYYYLYLYQSPQKDICPSCCVFHNRFRYASRKKTNEPGELAENAGEGILEYYKQNDIDCCDVEVEKELREACIDMKKDIYATVVLKKKMLSRNVIKLFLNLPSM